MRFLYNISMLISEKLLQLFGNFFGTKVRLFKQGQNRIFNQVKNCLIPEKKTIWFHVSSLGEYEQALPVIEAIKTTYPDKQILLTFFSPSGYEVKKDNPAADCITYLPIDTPNNVRRFLDLVQPETVFFVKYDFWPNYLFEVKNRNIPAYLISGLFTDKHKFFKPYNTWLKKSLHAFHHFFVQDEKSKEVLHKQGFKKLSVTGDTRFDRVYQIARFAEENEFVNQFKQNKPLLIAGSTWPKDEDLLIRYINQQSTLKTIIAPHQIDEAHIKEIKSKLQRPFIRFTDITNETDLSEYDVVILNTIGLLNKIYRYADLVYIGNGFGKSIHNIQEPAVFGVPIITGPHIQKFKEALDLKSLGGLITIQNYQNLKNTLDTLLNNDELRKEKARITKDYALKNVGATQKIMAFLKGKL